MAKSKYCEEIVNELCNSIAICGSNKQACEVNNLSPETFYQWMKRYPDFADRVARARVEYTKNSPSTLVRQARNKLAEYIEKGHTITRQKYFDGDLIEVTDNLNTPEWAIKMMLPPQHLEAAIEIVKRAGYLVIDPLAMKDAGIKQGLTAETMAMIRSEILGIEGVQITQDYVKQIDATPADLN